MDRAEFAARGAAGERADGQAATTRLGVWALRAADVPAARRVARVLAADCLGERQAWEDEIVAEGEGAESVILRWVVYYNRYG